jgi:multimeric flavodoxin WrbA
MKVVAFNGSARRGGNTAILLGYVLGELAQEGIETELVELSGATIHGCLACRKCSTRKDRRCSQSGDMGNVCIDKMAADVEKDEEGIQTMKTLGRNMAWLLKKLGS